MQPKVTKIKRDFERLREKEGENLAQESNPWAMGSLGERWRDFCSLMT
jgi:hypothetical protein